MSSQTYDLLFFGTKLNTLKNVSVLQNIHFEGNYPFKTKSLHSVAILETPWEAISKQQH